MTTKLDDTNKITKESVELFNELQNALDTSVSTLIPVLRAYLEDVRSIRMAFAAEVKHIIQSTSELNMITKSAPDLIKLGEAIKLIDSILSSNLKDKITSTFNVK